MIEFGVLERGVLLVDVGAHDQVRSVQHCVRIGRARVWRAGQHALCTLRRAQHRCEVATPRRVGVQPELKPELAVALALRNDRGQRIDRALLGSSEYRHDHDHRPPSAQALVERAAQRADIKPRIEIDGNRQVTAAAEADQRRTFRPRVVRRSRCED